MADNTPKIGGFPNADRANLFGTFYMAFYEKWHQGGDRDACWPSFAALLGIARSKADVEFVKAYEAIVNRDGKEENKLSLTEMNEVVWECWALMTRAGTWDWQREEEGELIAP